ncbi:MAG: PEP-CTERM sorting domain-containing protein [Betaproteobacteria bacterium]
MFNFSKGCLVAGGAVMVMASAISTAGAATVYNPGVAPMCAGCTVGNHLVAPDPTPSVAGVGGAGFNKAAGSALDGQRTYTYDQGGLPDLTDGIANRGDAGFAMMIWDMGTAFDTMILYTHQDHYAGGPISDVFVAQDVMEYSVWGSQDGNNFALLSDVTGFNINGGGAGLPTYTFAGTAPSIVFRGGSTEFGALNAYSREYTFGTAYRYYGVRASTVTLGFNNGVSVPAQFDGDPELDAVMAHAGPALGVPEPETYAMLLAGLGLLGFSARRKIHKAT